VPSSSFVDVIVPAEGFVDVQFQVLGRVDVVKYLSIDGVRFSFL
jgi:hypothetical protein